MNFLKLKCDWWCSYFDPFFSGRNFFRWFEKHSRPDDCTFFSGRNLLCAQPATGHKNWVFSQFKVATLCYCSVCRNQYVSMFSTHHYKTQASPHIVAWCRRNVMGLVDPDTTSSDCAALPGGRSSSHLRRARLARAGLARERGRHAVTFQNKTTTNNNDTMHYSVHSACFMSSPSRQQPV